MGIPKGGRKLVAIAWRKACIGRGMENQMICMGMQKSTKLRNSSLQIEGLKALSEKARGQGLFSLKRIRMIHLGWMISWRKRKLVASMAQVRVKKLNFNLKAQKLCMVP